MNNGKLHQAIWHILPVLASLPFVFASCTTEAESADTETVVPGEKVVLRIQACMDNIEPANTRATVTAANKTTLDADGNATLDGEKAIYNICVATFDANGGRLSYGYYTKTDGTTSFVQDITTTTAAKTVMILANYPVDIKLPSTVTLADFKLRGFGLDYTTDINATSGAAVNVYNCQTTTLPAYGEISVTDLKPYPQVNVTLNVPLKRMVSRIYLKSFKIVFDNEYTGASFTPSAVFMYNYATIADITNGSNDFLSYFKSSESQTLLKYMNSGPITLTTEDNTAINNKTAIPSLTGKYMFYVFPNTTTSPTKLVIKGNYRAPSSTTDVTMYYPIRINTSADGSTGGNQDGYDITAATHDGTLQMNKTISLDLTIHGSGVLNPADDILPASVTVNKTVADWNSVAPVQTYQDVTPQVGWYYYSDGSWGPSAAFTDATEGKHPIALIVSTSPTTDDAAAGFTHGYAMSLKGTVADIKWATINLTTTEFGTANYSSNLPLLLSNRAGYANTRTILKRNHLSGGTSSEEDGTATSDRLKADYPAFWYATVYTQQAVPAPSNTINSGWFMPSTGQWFDVLQNIGNLTPTSFPVSALDPTTTNTAVYRYNTAPLSTGKTNYNTVAAKINVYLQAAKNNTTIASNVNLIDGISTPGNGHLFASNEANNQVIYTCSFWHGAGDVMAFTPWLKNYHYGDFSVRSFIAF